VKNVDEDEVVQEAAGEFVASGLSVDGRYTTAHAIDAHDSSGNEYVILAEEANPLIVKFISNAVSVGVTGFDAALWTLIKAVVWG